MHSFRIALIALIVILSPLFSLGQNESFLGLCLGTAIPQGVYSEEDFYNDQAGYAKTGFLFSFDGAIFPDDYLGFGATVTYGSNNPNKTQYKEDIAKDLLDRYPGLDLDYINERLYFDYGVWRYLNFHVGPAFTFGAGNFNFDIKALAGLSLAWAPQQLIEIKLSDEETFSRKVNEKAIPTLGYTVGAGVRYALKSGYVIRVIAEFTNCKPKFDVNEDILSTIEEESELSTREVALPIKNIHFGIGIAYNFEI